MFSVRRSLSIAGVAGVFIVAQMALASPPGSRYTPGETLNPNCAAGDANCTVTVPLQSSGNLSDVGSASAARANLGLVINSDVQGYSAALASIGGLTTAATNMIYTTASNTYATTDLSAVARTLVSKTTTGAMTTYLRAVTPVYTGNIVVEGKVTANLLEGDASLLTNLSINDGAITSAKIADGTIANADISNSASIAFSKLNIAKSDITGLGIPASDTTYTAGTGLQLVGTVFSVTSSVVTSNYGGSVILAGSVSPASIAASTSDSSIPNSMTNTSSNGGAGVLKLSLSNISNPATTNRYIDFFANGGSIGSIKGNGAGSVDMSWATGNPAAFNTAPGLVFESAGADYAEYLERSDHAEVLRPGDIVGVKGGKISRTTAGADRAMVVSAAPVVVGNKPAGSADNFATVAFVGQVFVRVAGPVASGEYIVASGKNDGRGIAKHKNDLTAEDLLVGQAWDTVSTHDDTVVRIGITPGPVVISASSAAPGTLETEVRNLRQEIERLKQTLHE